MNETIKNLIARRDALLSHRADLVNQTNVLNAQIIAEEQRAAKAAEDGVEKCYARPGVSYCATNDGYWMAGETYVQKIVTQPVTQSTTFKGWPEIPRSEFLAAFKSRMTQIWEKVTGEKMVASDPVAVAAVKVGEASIRFDESCKSGTLGSYGDSLQEYKSAVDAYRAAKAEFAKAEASK